MGLLKFLKSTLAQMPVTPQDGSIYFDVDNNALTFDIDDQRYRVNCPANWEETNENSPAFIENRPTLGTASAKDLATEIGQNAGIPTAKLVADALRERDAQIGILKNNWGTPLVARTIAEMTDTAHPYVYSGNENDMIAGHWYYYDTTNNEWADGGLYNAATYTTDKTLLLADQPADSKTVGDALNELEYAVLEHDSRFSFSVDENGHLIQTVDRIEDDRISFSLNNGRMIVTYG